MGELVSLCQYRAQKRQEAEAATHAEVDALREIVDAWIEYMGEPESQPIVVLSGETLEPVTFGDWADWT
jgi:hypothetical protein